jgi:membrane carboxypeptidase/penicillin-binding protein
MRIAKLILSTLFTICILGLVAGGVLYFHLKSSLPSVESLKTVELDEFTLNAKQVAGELLPLAPVLTEVKRRDFLPLSTLSIGSKNTLKTDRTLFLFSALPF